MNETSIPQFSEPVADLIYRRRSVRTYSRIPLPEDIQEKLLLYFQQLKGPFPVEVRFQLLHKPEVLAQSQLKLGTYGIIQGVSSFVAAAIPKKEYNLEQLGYLFENLILYLTSLGLGTCWLAGTFTKSEFSQAMKIGPDELLPIVTPIGYPGWVRSPIDLLLKPIPQLKSRKAWNRLFFQDKFGAALDPSAAGPYALPLEMVRLAPSAANHQPWRIVRVNRLFHFYLQHHPRYSRAYPYDVQKIDLGIAMFHFDAVTAEEGLKGHWEIQKPVFDKIPENLEYIISWVSES
ncbi:MAG TPA: nitroreductase family protein [Bacillota bacterium]|nr:nitroreductase family protein [Bacillota bacterium]